MGGCDPYVSNFGMLTSSTKTTTFFPNGAPNNVFFFFSSFNSIISWVRALLVCAEKFKVTGTTLPSFCIFPSTTLATTDFPTPIHKNHVFILILHLQIRHTRFSCVHNWIVDLQELFHNITKSDSVNRWD